MDSEQAFGQVLKERRRARGMTQEALAEAAGCHRAHISWLERGRKSPTLHMLFQLAAALDVSPSELVRKVEERVAASSGTGE